MSTLKRIRGIKALVHGAVDLTADLIATGHASGWGHAARVADVIAGPSSHAGELVELLHRVSIGSALGTVRVVNRLVARLTDAGLDAATAAALLASLDEPGAPLPMRSDVMGTRAWLAESALGALNGAVGDYLHREGNALDLGFSLRLPEAVGPAEPRGAREPVDQADAPGSPGSRGSPGSLAPLRLGPRVAVFVHGLGVTEWSWCMKPGIEPDDPTANLGTLLERDLGFTPVFARYNSGRRVFENGALLSEALERLVTEHPALGGEDAEILLVGHSMGGLVARSACEHAAREGHAWVTRAKRVFCLGTPHQGAPLEQLGHALTRVLGAIDLPGTRIPAEILARRSAGVRDLRRGTIADDAARAIDPAAARASEASDGSGASDACAPVAAVSAVSAAGGLRHLTYHFACATVTRDPTNPVGELIGDLLVPVSSARGPASPCGPVEARAFGELLHHEIQTRRDVYEWLRATCRPSHRG